MSAPRLNRPEDDAATHRFYEDLAGQYHLIFADWEQSIRYQREVLDRLIRAHLDAATPSVLDCTCGIGTQALGLAALGYRVHATDISPASVARAGREAARRAITLTTGVADLRTLAEQVAGTFDVVLSCDNALPHLLTDKDLRLATRNMQEKLRPGGLLLASIRDYDAALVERPHTTLPRVFEGPEGRRVVFQVWDWMPDAPRYTLNQFILDKSGPEWRTHHWTAAYRALRRSELDEVLQAAGFQQIRWQMPEESGYYQPVVTARKR